MIKVNERTPFYLISTIFLFISIILSFSNTFYTTKCSADFFPIKGNYHGKEIHDSSYIDKLCWYFSQITHHTIFLLFSYFFLALINLKSEKFFKMVAPLALTISVLYFYYLYPKQSLKVHQLSFFNFFSHFMIIFLIFGEFIYIKNYKFNETSNCFVFIISSLLAVIINYLLRGVWSYDLIKLDSYKGWFLVSKTTLIMYFFSVMFCFFKYKNIKFYGVTPKDLKNSTWFFSGLINIIFFLLFTMYN
jgi:hypothetical protein